LRQALSEPMTRAMHKRECKDSLPRIKRTSGETLIQFAKKAGGLAGTSPTGEPLDAHGVKRTTRTAAVDRVASNMIRA
jgi:hypothetical protein